MTAPHVEAAQKVFFAALTALPKEERGQAAAAAPWIKNGVAMNDLAVFLKEQPGHPPEAYWIEARHRAEGAGEAWADAPQGAQFAWHFTLETLSFFRHLSEPEPEAASPPPPSSGGKRIGKRVGKIGKRVKGLEPLQAEKTEAEGEQKTEAEGEQKTEAEGEQKTEAEGEQKTEAEGEQKTEAEGEQKTEAEGEQSQG